MQKSVVVGDQSQATLHAELFANMPNFATFITYHACSYRSYS